MKKKAENKFILKIEIIEKVKIFKIYNTYLSCNSNSFSISDSLRGITSFAPKALEMGIACGLQAETTYPPHNLTSWVRIHPTGVLPP